MKKKLIALALSATMALSAGFILAGCNPDEPGPALVLVLVLTVKKKVSLVLWGPSQQQEMAEEMIEAFKQEYTDKEYTITYNVVSEMDAASQITTDVSAVRMFMHLPMTSCLSCSEQVLSLRLAVPIFLIFRRTTRQVR